MALRLPSQAFSNPGNRPAWVILVLGTGYLSWRYETSAAFEHPIYFSLYTLLCSAALSISFALWRTGRRRSLRTLASLLLRALSWRFLFVVALVVGRTLLWNLSIQYVQCSFDGISAFAPFLLMLLDVVSLKQSMSYEALPTANDEHLYLSDPPPSPPLSEKKDVLAGAAGRNPQPSALSRGSLVYYIIHAISWGFMAHYTLLLTERPVGAVCPTYGGWGVKVLAGQVVMIMCDVLILLPVARMRRRSQEANAEGDASWAFVGALALFSAWALVFTVFGIRTFLVESAASYLTWAPAVHRVIVRDLFYDSIVASAVFVSAVSLLASTHPATITAIMGGAGVYFHYMRHVRDERGMVLIGGRHGLFARAGAIFAILSLFILIRSDSKLPGSPQRRTADLARRRKNWLSLSYVGFLVALFVNQHISVHTSVAKLPKIIWDAQRESDVWIRGAHESKSVEEAASAYRMRYDIPPPPHFDKWYAFAVRNNATVIDSFDQINDDLLPFWGIPPAVLRERTTHLLEQTSLGIGGLRIKKGKVELSPHTPGTHFWMMTGFEKMLEPFLQYLPDMDLAFNLDDECRVAVPFSEATAIADLARAARKRVPHRSLNKAFSKALEPPWGDSYWAENWAEKQGEGKSAHFAFRTKNAIFDEYIASTCPPTSPALTSRWWSRKAAMPAGRGVVADPAGAADLCRRIDIPHMHGFLLDPGAFAITRSWFPIFSQSRISGFSDILVPSPWNFMSKVEYEEEADRPWAEKRSSVFWRGSSSDGLSTRGGWTTFLRARFVHLAQQAMRWQQQEQQQGQKSASGVPAAAADAFRSAVNSTLSAITNPRHHPGRPRAAPPTIDVSFVGNFTKCHRPDCLSQTQTFYGAPAVADPPSGSDFQAHWLHRHLVDLDGAGFSGRFLPFLKSRSLVYRASLFRTWYDERVHAWRHFVPLDISLTDVWGVVGRMERQLPGGGRKHGKGNGMDGQEQGVAEGQETRSTGEIIATEGRDWALKALRKEDMQLYMFRLLLEWARLVDDRREALGYE